MLEDIIKRSGDNALMTESVMWFTIASARFIPLTDSQYHEMKNYWLGLRRRTWTAYE